MESSIIVSIITVAGSFILVYLSTVKDRVNQKYNVRKEQLNNFYIPFYQHYCAGFLFENSFSQLDLDGRSIFFDLFTKNLHLMEPTSQSMYCDFYRAFLDLLEAENQNQYFSITICSHNMDRIFSSISQTIFCEYKDILKKCHLPVPLI
mgnify:CR=1 FL=1